MRNGLISGDNHIDLTYCPPDLWSSQAPAKWRLLVPRVEELEDGCHWFVEGQDQGMWNGVGPRFLKYEPGIFGHIDEMKAGGFTWDYRRGAQPRPTTPELRLADLDRDGLDAEIVYGCLMINDLIASADLRTWTNQIYNDWAADFAKRSDPNRVFPLAIIPNTDPLAAAAEVRRCARLGLRGGDLAFKRLSVPLYHRGWDPVWEAAQECRFPISFHSTGFKGLRAPDTPEMEKEYAVPWRIVRASLFQLDGMEVLVSVIASGACERYPDFKFVLGESGVTWIPYVFDRLDTEYADRGRALGFSLKPSDYFRRQGYTTYQQ
ncbi:MAG TPA: amidohydrolase family protein, partial [Methylomirabilota bacterium]|nr:amidohydrolase family protein [Methylomirabilota bacterium]